MAMVLRLGALAHIEDALVRVQFDIEDFFGKLNGVRSLWKPSDFEHRRRMARRFGMARARLRPAGPGGQERLSLRAAMAA
jgi:hypothetical protein